MSNTVSRDDFERVVAVAEQALADFEMMREAYEVEHIRLAWLIKRIEQTGDAILGRKRGNAAG